MNRVPAFLLVLLTASCGGGSTKPATDPGPGTDEAAGDPGVEDPGPLADIHYPETGLDLGCANECVLGTKECAGAGWRTCTDLDGNGCAEWSAVTDCPLGTTCKDGVCSAACPDAPCTASGARKCDGNSWVKCEDANGDGCLEWGAATACDAGLVCSNGFCATSCKDACTVVGSTKCEGNSVVEGAKLVNPNVSAATTGNDYKTAVSPAWTTPKNQPILFLRVQYSESDHWSYNYETGYVRADGADGEVLYSATSGDGPVFKDISGSNVKSIVAVVVDNSSSYSATMSVPLAFYYEADLKKELSSVTDGPGSKVDCTNNYWGVFPNVQDRFTLGRADAINFDGFQITEISGNGPQ